MELKIVMGRQKRQARSGGTGPVLYNHGGGRGDSGSCCGTGRFCKRICRRRRRGSIDAHLIEFENQGEESTSPPRCNLVVGRRHIVLAMDHGPPLRGPLSWIDGAGLAGVPEWAGVDRRESIDCCIVPVCAFFCSALRTCWTGVLYSYSTD